MNFWGVCFFSLTLFGCTAKGPKELTQERVHTDVLQAAYVKNCSAQGLQLIETQILNQASSQEGLEVLSFLRFEGQETPETKAILCAPINTVKVHYRYEDGQAVFKRLSLELSRSQLNRFRQNK